MFLNSLLGFWTVYEVSDGSCTCHLPLLGHTRCFNDGEWSLGEEYCIPYTWTYRVTENNRSFERSTGNC